MNKGICILLIVLLVLGIGCGSAVLIDAPRTRSQSEQLMEEAVQTRGDGPFYAGDGTGTLYHRIPSLLTTSKGTVIAAADARFSGTEDSPNNLDTAVSYSQDGGNSWSDAALAAHFEDYADLSLPLRHSGKMSFARKKSASYIDPAMLEDKLTGRIFLLVDMFPSGTGAFQSEKGSGYTVIDGKSCLMLRKKGSSKLNYTVRENGVIYDKNGKPTQYSLNENMELLKNGTAMTVRQRSVWTRFNFLITKRGDKEVPMNIMYGNSLFQPLSTSYLCLKYSDDQGKTWSRPQILNPMVKEDSLGFLGVGPGRGTQISSGTYQGRLLFPVYQLDKETGKQVCSVIYSDDHGATWKRSASPAFDEAVVKSMSESQIVELPGGVLRMFSRTTAGFVAQCTSTDGGASWSEGTLVKELPTGGSSCQLSAINYSGTVDSKPAVLLSTPAGNNRTNGKISIGLVDGETIDWKYQYEVTPKDGAFLYSCLTQLPDGRIGLLYERGAVNQALNMLDYKTFPVEQLKQKES